MGALRERAPAIRARMLPAATCVALTLVMIDAVHRAERGTPIDFSVYLMGARHLFDGRLYQVGTAPPPHLPFTYPPFAAAVFLPLAALPQWASEAVWAIMGTAALAALTFLSLRCALPRMERRTRLLWSGILTLPAYLLEPVLLTFSFGQINVVLAALALADLTARLRVGNRTIPQGTVLGAVAALKLVPLVFIPYLFLTKRMRAAWVAVASFLICSIAPAAVAPAAWWSYWTRYSFDAQRVGGVDYISNQSLRAFLDRADHRMIATWVATAAAVAALVGGVSLARWAYLSSSNFLALLVCAATGLVASPISWAHHFVWIIPVLFWLALAPDRPNGGMIWAVAAAVLFYWAPLWTVPAGHDVELHETWSQLLVGSSFFFATVVFLAGVATMLAWRARFARIRRRARRGSQSAEPRGTTHPCACPMTPATCSKPAA